MSNPGHFETKKGAIKHLQDNRCKWEPLPIGHGSKTKLRTINKAFKNKILGPHCHDGKSGPLYTNLDHDFGLKLESIGLIELSRGHGTTHVHSKATFLFQLLYF